MIGFAENERAFYDVLQLANVSRPVVALQKLQGLLGDIRDTFSGFLGVASNEVLDEQRNIFGSLAQRRNYDRKNIQPVEKVGAEGSRRHRSPQVTIGCRDHP